MRTFYSTLFILICFLVTGQNNVINGGFENFTGTTPNDWTTIESGITTNEETTIVNGGSKSLKVNLLTLNQDNTDLRQNINVINGVTYDISVDIYNVGGDNDARARLYVDGFKNYSSPAIIDTWQTLTSTYTATANGSIEVGLRFYDVSPFDGSAVIYVDNYKVINQTLSAINNKLNTFSIYPNPVNKGVAHIKSASKNTINVKVYTILGTPIFSQELMNGKLDVSNLDSGVYLINLEQDKNVTIKKLVIL